MDTPRLRELQLQYDSQINEKDKIDTLIDMAIEVRNFDVERASELADEVISRSDKDKFARGTARGLNLKGTCYWLQGAYDNALEVLNKAIIISKQIKDRKLEARILNNFGNIYRDTGDLANALNYFENALAINEELGDEIAQSVNLTSISNLHYDLNDYDSALEYALKCLPIFERSQDINRLITIYNALGNIYFKQEKFGEALQYFEENLKQSDVHSGTHVMAVSGRGKVYYKMNNFESARIYLSQALEQAQELGNVEVQIISHFYLGRLFMDEANYRKSLLQFNTAFTLAEESMRRHDLMSVHEMLSVLYDKMGDIPMAFHHLKTFELLKEEIFNQTTLNKLRNLQIRQQIELSRKEKEVAEQTAHLKQQFMANMSHEIRTPMNAVVGMTRLLLSKDPRPDQLKYLHAIRQSADNLLVIINDILDLSKIEAGKIEIEATEFSPQEVMQSMGDMLLLKAEEKGITLHLDIDPAIPQRLIGDPTRLNQILINLTGNAIKFTEKGSVYVNAKLQKSEPGTMLVRFEIIDTGIGIAQEYVDKIFDSFTQAGSDVARKFGGTGLGLTISKQLATLMNGEINVKSELNQGTTFTVSIPFGAAKLQTGGTETKVVDPLSIKRINNSKILLVEDNEFNRMVAEDTLKELFPDITIDIAINGNEAVNRVQKEIYDLLLMDIQMPVMDGVTATRIIRSLPKPVGDVKIIAMTANVLQEDMQLYLMAGMNAYVSKPFQTDELILKMAATLENKIVEETKATVVPASKTDDVLPDQIIDMQFLKQFAGGKTDKINKYISMFLENAPNLLANLEKGLKERDFTTIKIAAHSLKPQLSYMGVKEEVSRIFLIEQTAGEAHYERLPQLVNNLITVCTKAFEELKKFKANN